MVNSMNNTGKHVTADIYLTNEISCADLMNICEQAIKKSMMNIVSCSFKQFMPHGLTAIWILEESHFTLHTYPEHSYLSVDCYTCGDEGKPDLAVNHLIDRLPVRDKIIAIMQRGILNANQ
jgi:S-adenosylmethionine decarboxylase